MKKINFATAVAAVILALSVGLGISFRGQNDETSSQENSSREEILKTVVADRVKYIMREYEGHIAVFNEDGTLHRLYEVNVELLPEYDRKLLKDGIQITGEEELRARVEDYTS